MPGGVGNPPTGPGPAGAGPADFLTTNKNLVQAVNGFAQLVGQINGALNKAAISTITVVRQGQGRLATVSVTTAGASGGPGVIYDTNLVTSTANPIYVIPTAVGLYVVNLPVSNGIVVVPQAGQVLTVSYA